MAQNSNVTQSINYGRDRQTWWSQRYMICESDNEKDMRKIMKWHVQPRGFRDVITWKIVRSISLRILWTSLLSEWPAFGAFGALGGIMTNQNGARLNYRCGCGRFLYIRTSTLRLSIYERRVYHDGAVIVLASRKPLDAYCDANCPHIASAIHHCT